MRWIRYFQPDRQISGFFQQAFLITLLGNICLAILKIWAAKASGSSAIYSDAVNSISDVFYSLLLIAGLWLSQQPPDLSHPQGHSRFEPIAALLVTLAMAFAGIEAMRASILRSLQGGTIIPLGIALLAMLGSMLIKFGMFLKVHQISLKTSSPGLQAAARDNLSDVITSLAALMGIVGSNFIHPMLDPLAGILVAFWIVRAVFLTARQNLGYLTGAGADEHLREILLASVQKVPGVQNIHHVITEYAGPKLVVEMHINVDGDLSLHKAHEICDQATQNLESLPEVDRAYVHVEPIGFT